MNILGRCKKHEVKKPNNFLCNTTLGYYTWHLCMSSVYMQLYVFIITWLLALIPTAQTEMFDTEEDINALALDFMFTVSINLCEYDFVRVHLTSLLLLCSLICKGSPTTTITHPHNCCLCQRTHRRTREGVLHARFTIGGCRRALG